MGFLYCYARTTPDWKEAVGPDVQEAVQGYHTTCQRWKYMSYIFPNEILRGLPTEVRVLKDKEIKRGAQNT